MNNLPPPDRRPSPLGFDEFVAVLVAFVVIGTIFFVSLRNKDGKFSLKNLTPSLKTEPASPNAPAIPIAPTTQNIPTSQLAPTPSVTDSPIVVPTNQIPTSQIAPTPLTKANPGQQQAKAATPRKAPNSTAMIAVPGAKSAKSEKKQPLANKTVNFPDVPQVFWARPYIEALAARGILTGYPDRNFNPNKPVTRAEFAANLQKAFDQKVVVPGQKYKDISDQFWASSAIQETTRSGFLRGYPDQAFRPDQTISKVEALVALTKGLGLTDKGTANQVVKYQDAKSIPKYAKDVVAIATEYGLVVNYPNRNLLNPNKPLTRAEAAALTYQGMVQAGKVPAVTSEYVAQPQ